MCTILCVPILCVPILYVPILYVHNFMCANFICAQFIYIRGNPTKFAPIPKPAPERALTPILGT